MGDEFASALECTSLGSPLKTQKLLKQVRINSIGLETIKEEDNEDEIEDLVGRMGKQIMKMGAQYRWRIRDQWILRNFGKNGPKNWKEQRQLALKEIQEEPEDQGTLERAFRRVRDLLILLRECKESKNLKIRQKLQLSSNAQCQKFANLITLLTLRADESQNQKINIEQISVSEMSKQNGSIAQCPEEEKSLKVEEKNEELIDKLKRAEERFEALNRQQFLKKQKNPKISPHNQQEVQQETKQLQNIELEQWLKPYDIVLESPKCLQKKVQQEFIFGMQRINMALSQEVNESSPSSSLREISGQNFDQDASYIQEHIESKQLEILEQTNEEYVEIQGTSDKQREISSGMIKFDS